MKDYYVHPTACVDQPCKIGAGTKIWHFSHVSSDCEIGENCSFGQNVFIANGVRIGNTVKVQNNVSLYGGVILEDFVFCGPSCVFTNVSNPRSEIVRRGSYETTLAKKGTSIGANATIVCGTVLGRYSFIGASAVVTKDVSDYALMVGVPARRVGWMGRHGYRLEKQSNFYVCPVTGFRYQLADQDVLHCLDLREDDPLPPSVDEGQTS